MQPANLYRPRCSVPPRSRQICPQADSHHQRTLGCKSVDHGPISGCLNPGYDSELGQKLSNSLTQPITREGRKAFRNTCSVINSSTSPSASPQPPHAVIRQRNPLPLRHQAECHNKHRTSCEGTFETVWEGQNWAIGFAWTELLRQKMMVLFQAQLVEFSC